MIYHCCDERRRTAVALQGALNGIDYVEVLDDDAPEGSPRQRTLLVRLLKDVPAGLGAENVRIEGGERVRNITIEWTGIGSGSLPNASSAEKSYLNGLPEAARVLVVRTDSSGDFSAYSLRLARSRTSEEPPKDFDAQLSSIDFSFKIDCPSPFDCRPEVLCPEEPLPAPPIDYLAKDYPSFRRLVLDRLSQLVPGWSERSAADLGVALAELLAYTADQLSYQQDAIATEAYLETARLRTSLRRHALLVDYHLHDGNNARVWIHVAVLEENVNLPKAGTRFYARVPGQGPAIKPGSPADREALRQHPVVFELLEDATLHRDHNEIRFYTWGDERCCLPTGATGATLAGHLGMLAVNDVLLFEEVVGPATGEPGDADPQHRHAVRLTGVTNTAPPDPSDPDNPPQLEDPLTGEPITRIEWAPADALPFPLCISSVTDSAHDGAKVPVVSVARGNMVLADHGLTLPEEVLGVVPQPRITLPPPRAAGCEPADPVPVPPRFRPRIDRSPLTFTYSVPKATVVDGNRRVERVPFDPERPAAEAIPHGIVDTLPAIKLHSTFEDLTEEWVPRRDLLNSGPDDTHFVVEVEGDATARLRFGNGVHGVRPRPGTLFTAEFRIGNGRTGNVGAEAIKHAVTDSSVLLVRNPLPARGGAEMEDLATVRRRAPQAFRRQERAVTTSDYSEMTQRAFGVERAAATMHWSGSWHTVFITVDRAGGILMDDEYEGYLTQQVEPYRMAGHDTEFNDPNYVSLEMMLQVCVKDGYLRSDVRAGLLQELGNRTLPDGRRGLFHPDRLSFGQTVFLSPVYAAARRVPGVESADVTVFQRQGIPDPGHLSAGFMRLSRLEIPRLDNDPNFPEHGLLTLNLTGGR